MRPIYQWLAGALLGLVCAPVHTQDLSGKVVVVMDGDTLLAFLRCSNGAPNADAGRPFAGCAARRPVKIRLADIDAPEANQPGGADSQHSLASLVLQKQVSVQVRAADKYGRLVAHIVLGATSVNAEQIRRGMAWEYSGYHRNKEYAALQSEARRARRGLWAQANPMPPWHWRKMHAPDAPGSGPAAAGGACGSKRYCAQMESCAEARFYFTRCRLTALDANNDGVPCEALCRPK